jgi:glycosyltransferase involved in cell wall biosynthesis
VDELPFVSVLCPTRDRRAFLPRLIAMFQRQDWPKDRLELVVVDDGRDRVADLIPKDDPRIRYEALDQRVPLGTKRNRLCELANGEILVHMDDDDWFPDARVARAVEGLRTSGAEVVGTSDLAFWDYGSRAIHLVPRIGPKHVCAGTMAYPKTYWEKAKWAPDPHTEERQFLQNFAAKVAHLPGNPWDTVLCISHGENILPKNTHLPRAKVTLADVVTDPADRAFYESIDPDAW